MARRAHGSGLRATGWRRRSGMFSFSNSSAAPARGFQGVHENLTRGEGRGGVVPRSPLGSKGGPSFLPTHLDFVKPWGRVCHTSPPPPSHTPPTRRGTGPGCISRPSTTTRSTSACPPGTGPPDPSPRDPTTCNLHGACLPPPVRCVHRVTCCSNGWGGGARSEGSPPWTSFPSDKAGVRRRQ